MKIAFILSHSVLTPSNGIVSQAKTWKRGLEQIGHEVVLIDMWQNNDWKSFDIIHFYGFSIYMRDFIIGVSKINPNIVVSPILDPDYSVNRLKLYSHFGISKLNLTNPYHGLYSVKDKVKQFFVRSQFEKNYMLKGFNVKDNQCAIVPLSYNVKESSELSIRENFCLHISLLTDPRKNVRRLIEASKKFDFKLVLGGKLRNKKEEELLKSWIGNHKNIEYRGYLSNEELISLYRSAKVFALPSTNEGVGIVGLEAAAMGCDIVITSLGGPKEYYNGLAEIVNPYDVDDIGKAVIKLMHKQTNQPQLKNHITSNYSLEAVSNNLICAYKEIINSEL